MKRDMGLVRELMLAIEQFDIPANCFAGFYLGDGGLQVEGTTTTRLRTISYG